MERFDTHICATDRALQERPKVFNSVSVNLSVNVLLSMIDNIVDVGLAKLIVRAKRVAIDSRASFDVLTHFAVKRCALGIRYNHRPNLTMSRQQAHNGDLACGL